MELTGIGIWSSALRWADPLEIADAAAEVESLGYTAVWTPGGVGGDIWGACRRLLDATRSVVVATGIVNIWMHEPAETARGHVALRSAHPGRFLLGLGISHAALVDAKQPGTYRKPLAVTRAYLEELDATETPVPHDEMVLAALGPAMLDLARERTLGSHPYLVTPEHTRMARERLGGGRLLAPETPVVLEQDPTRAREIARKHLTTYLRLPNYVNNLLRLGFTEDDVAAGGSNRLVDGVIAWGTADVIAKRIADHRAAGADHVCVQVLGTDRTVLQRAAWSEIASAAIGT